MTPPTAALPCCPSCYGDVDYNEDLKAVQCQVCSYDAGGLNNETRAEAIAHHLLLCRAPAVQATADADGAAKEIVAGDLFDPEHTGWSLNKSVPIEVVTERISAIIRKAVSPKAAADEPSGSSVCPICGRDAPHYHPPEVVSQHYGTVKSGSLNQNYASPAAVSGDKQEKER